MVSTVRSTILNHFKNTLTDRVAEQKQNILYHRHIISVKSTGKVPKATNCYWTQEDIEEEEDEKICILQLLTA